MGARLFIGDVLDVLAKMPDDSVDLVITSPPFLALRSYLPADHPDKAKEIGSEPTPGEFIDALLDVTEALDRVLAPHGSICVELGDTYSGSGGAGGDYGPDGLREGQPKFRAGYLRNDRDSRVPQDDPKSAGKPRSPRPKYIEGESEPVRTHSRAERPGWPIEKSLCLIPELYRIALVYGFNPLTGRTTPRWRARNVVRWARPNPPVGALGDKVRPATSDIVIACHSRTRYFDLDAVRHPADEANKRPSVLKREGIGGRTDQVMNPLGEDGLRIIANSAGAPPLDHWWHDDVFEQDTWLVSTEPFKGAHYATWPRDLVVKPIASMCPERVCVVCGEPSRRITEQSQDLDPSRPQAKRAMELAEAHGLTPEHIAAVYATGITDAGKAKVTMSGNGRNSAEVQRLAVEAKEALGGYFREFTMSNQVTTGWTTCGHDDWRPGVVLDPFVGSGTTLAVATGHGRDAIGVDLDSRNVPLVADRCGMFLSEVIYVGQGEGPSDEVLVSGGDPV